MHCLRTTMQMAEDQVENRCHSGFVQFLVWFQMEGTTRLVAPLDSAMQILPHWTVLCRCCPIGQRYTDIASLPRTIT